MAYTVCKMAIPSYQLFVSYLMRRNSRSNHATVSCSLTGILMIQPVEASVFLIHITQNSSPTAANSSHIRRSNCAYLIHLTFDFVLGLIGL